MHQESVSQESKDQESKARAVFRLAMPTLAKDRKILGFGKIAEAPAKAANFDAKYEWRDPDEARAIRQKMTDVIVDWKGRDPAEFHTAEGLFALIRTLAAIEDSAGALETPDGHAARGVHRSVCWAVFGLVPPEHEKPMESLEQVTGQLHEIEGMLVQPDARVGAALLKLQVTLAEKVDHAFKQPEMFDRYLAAAGVPHLAERLAAQVKPWLLPHEQAKPQDSESGDQEFWDWTLCRLLMPGVSSDKTILDFSKIDAALAEEIKKHDSPENHRVCPEMADAVRDWRGRDPARFHTAEGLFVLRQKLKLIDACVLRPQGTGTRWIYDHLGRAVVDQAPQHAKEIEFFKAAENELYGIEIRLSRNPDARIGPTLRGMQSALSRKMGPSFEYPLGRYLAAAGVADLAEHLTQEAAASLTPRTWNKLDDVEEDGLGAQYEIPESLYARSMPGVWSDKTILNFNGIDEALARVCKSFEGRDLPLQTRAVLQNMAETIDDWRGRYRAKFHTAAGMTLLKQELKKIRDRAELSPQGFAADRLYRAVRLEIFSRVPPGHVKEMKAFEEAARQIERISRALWRVRDIDIMPALRKLQATLGREANPDLWRPLDFGNYLLALNHWRLSEILAEQAVEAITWWTPHGLARLWKRVWTRVSDAIDLWWRRASAP